MIVEVNGMVQHKKTNLQHTKNVGEYCNCVANFYKDITANRCKNCRRPIRDKIRKEIQHVMQTDLFNMVSEFHEKFDLEVIGKNLPVDVANYRVGFLQEELDEIKKGYQDGNNEEVLDGLVDLVYVALGTAYFHGFDFNEAFRRVHVANLNKQRASDSTESKRGSSLDLVKPEGSAKPYLADLIP